MEQEDPSTGCVKKHGDKKSAKKKREASEKAAIDSAMQLLEDAKQKVEVEKQEYSKFLSWKVKMQRKERRVKEREAAAERTELHGKLADKLAEEKAVAREKRRSWSKQPGRQRTVRAAPPMVGDRPTLGAVKHQQMLQEKQAKRAAAADSQHQQPIASTAAAPAQAPPVTGALLCDKTTYENFTKMLKDDINYRSNLGTATTEHFEEILNKTRQQRETRVAKTEFMFTQAVTRRQRATARMERDPPADCLLTQNILKYLPPEFVDELENDISKEATRPSTVAEKSHFFLTAVDGEDSAALSKSLPKVKDKKPVRKSLFTTKWSWLAKLPLPPRAPTPQELSPEMTRFRQGLERKQLDDYLTDMSKGYHKTEYRTEHHGKGYQWARHHRYALPSQKSSTFTLAMPG